MGTFSSQLGWTIGGLITVGIAAFALSSPTIGARAAAINEFRPASAREEIDPSELLRTPPVPVSPALNGIGRLIPDVRVTNLNGKPQPVRSLMGPKGLVIALVSSSCPVSQKMAPALGRINADAMAKGFGFLYMSSVATDTNTELMQAGKSAGWHGTMARDPKGALLTTLDASSTTEVFVLDGARTVAYRGAVSDQYGPTWAKDTPTVNYLQDALTAIAAGETPKVPATTAPGCVLERAKRSMAPTTNSTYHNRISRIIQAHCVECHRSGGVAPFSLETYQDVIAHAGMIGTVVPAGQMPPWSAAPPKAGAHSPWANDRRMPAADKKDLMAWLKGARPVGEATDAPLPRKFDPEWGIGKPDAVFGFDKPLPVKAEGVMPYQTVMVETQLPEDKWVQAIEVKPGARAVVHHVLVFVSEPGKGRLGAAAEEHGGFFGAYVPGTAAMVYPEGYAKKLPKGAILRFQMHYTPNGTATEDLTRIGFQWAKTPPQHEIKVAGISSLRLSIPPGAENHKEQGEIPVPMDVQVMAFMPHMHVRAKACRYELITPDGKRETLLDVPRYDFNWQLTYRLATPRTIPAGSKVEFAAWYDNSAKNPYNPDPTKTVHWGPQTFDEMLLGYVEYVADEGSLRRSGPLRDILERARNRRNGASPANNNRNIEQTFQRLDKNQDGKVTQEEAGNLWERVKNADANQDGGITLEEAKAFFGKP